MIHHKNIFPSKVKPKIGENKMDKEAVFKTVSAHMFNLPKNLAF